MKPGTNDRLNTPEILDAYRRDAAPAVDFSQEPAQYRDCVIASTPLFASVHHESWTNGHLGLASFDDDSKHRSPASISVADFIVHKFIPNCVAYRRSSARSHFRTMLNHVLHPELVSDALSTLRGTTKKRLTTIPGWPYLDGLQLREVDAEVIQRLVNEVLKRGYSIQMARQIRSVMSLIMAHGIRTGYCTGPNPATFVALSAKPKKETHTLDLDQLASALRIMDYPERHVALFLILAELRVTEICGLQWKYVNLSPTPSHVKGEVIPPKTIAVRNQIYRGEFTMAVGSRRRFVRIPDLLCSVLRDLRGGQPFPTPDNFVLASRNGTPVHPENIAARRLRFIGRSLGMPWLSWSVFVRSRNLLRSQSGRGFHQQLQAALTPPEQTTKCAG